MAAAPLPEAAFPVSGLGERLRSLRESRFTARASPRPCGDRTSAACARADMFSQGAGLSFPGRVVCSAVVASTVLPCITWTPAFPHSGTRVRAECRSHPGEVEAIAVEFEEK